MYSTNEQVANKQPQPSSFDQYSALSSRLPKWPDARGPCVLADIFRRFDDGVDEVNAIMESVIGQLNKQQHPRAFHINKKLAKLSHRKTWWKDTYSFPLGEIDLNVASICVDIRG